MKNAFLSFVRYFRFLSQINLYVYNNFVFYSSPQPLFETLSYVHILGLPLFLLSTAIYSNTYNSMASGNRRFNTEFTRTLHLSLSGAKSTQFLLLTPNSLIHIVILSSHLRLDNPKGLFPGDLHVLFL